MKFKNFQGKPVRVNSDDGLHCVYFESGETREVPEHLEEVVIRAGMVPLDHLEDIEEKQARLQRELEEQQKAEAEAKAIAELEKAEALEKAAAEQKAKVEAEAAQKRSERAKKAAATKAAKKKAGAQE